ncbi:MAG: HD domain-containing phosphohydrolase [Bacillota bacterium]
MMDLFNKYDKENIYNLIYNNIKQGVALHKIIYEGKVPIDYQIKDVNEAFVNLIGIPKETAVKAMATDLYNLQEPPYLEKYAQVAKTGKTEEFETYFEPMDRYFKITVTSPKKDFFITLFQDITEEKMLNKELSLKDFSINQAGFGVFWINPDGTIKYVNNEACNYLNYKKEKLQQMNVSEIAPMYPKWKRKEIWEIIKKEKSRTCETFHQTRNGKLIPVKVNSRYINYQGEEYEFAFIVDISERKQRERELHYNFYHDNLTGLFNSTFIDRKADEIDRNIPANYSVIMADINGLRMINDSYGHKKGNQVIKKVASLLKSSIDEDEVLARYGGDEFIIYQPDSDEFTAEQTINRIDKNLKDLNEKECIITIGLGYATKCNNETFYEVLNRAQRSLYKHKLIESNSDKNKIVKNSLNILGTKSQETKEHALRMTALAHKIGEKVGLNNEELNNLSLLATLHDIGKTYIPEEILNKPGNLTEEEWQLIKEHPERGSRIAAASEDFQDIAEEILYHHERWDGKGYPEGLKGQEIPLLSRIISIVDSFDVMTNERPYSKPMTKEDAIQELKNCAGTQFDPDLVKIFVSVLENEPEKNK